VPRPTNAAAKESVNLTVRSELLVSARRAKLNLSAILDQALTEQLKLRSQQQWLEENKAGFAAYNERVEKHGLFSDGQRSF
jgi:antitoxin CcdA